MRPTHVRWIIFLGFRELIMCCAPSSHLFPKQKILRKHGLEVKKIMCRVNIQCSHHRPVPRLPGGYCWRFLKKGSGNICDDKPKLRFVVIKVAVDADRQLILRVHSHSGGDCWYTTDRQMVRSCPSIYAVLDTGDCGVTDLGVAEVGGISHCIEKIVV